MRRVMKSSVVNIAVLVLGMPGALVSRGPRIYLRDGRVTEGEEHHYYYYMIAIIYAEPQTRKNEDNDAKGQTYF